jgi:hypothetical protein
MSLGPPENATRNFAKVVQRVPVKIHGRGARRAAAEDVAPVANWLKVLKDDKSAIFAASGGVGDRGHALNHFATLGTAVVISYLRRTSNREIG